MSKAPQKTLLSRTRNSDAERDLYQYTGYYPCDTQKENFYLYVSTDNDGIGYGKRILFPGTICIRQDNIDMNKTITIYPNESNFKIGDLPLDTELMRILQDLTEELQLKNNQTPLYNQQLLLHKIEKWRQINWNTKDSAPIPTFTDTEIRQMMECYYQNVTYDKEYE